MRLSLQLIYPSTFYANKDKSSISVCITADGLCMQHKRNSFKKIEPAPRSGEGGGIRRLFYIMRLEDSIYQKASWLRYLSKAG